MRSKQNTLRQNVRKLMSATDGQHGPAPKMKIRKTKHKSFPLTPFLCRLAFFFTPRGSCPKHSSALAFWLVQKRHSWWQLMWGAAQIHLYAPIMNWQIQSWIQSWILDCIHDWSIRTRKWRQYKQVVTCSRGYIVKLVSSLTLSWGVVELSCKRLQCRVEFRLNRANKP